jgi:hypothetical protein
MDEAKETPKRIEPPRLKSEDEETFKAKIHELEN